MNLKGKSRVIIRSGRKFVVNHPKEPRLVDWRDLEKQANAIIKDVKRPIRMFSIKGERTRPGVDLEAHSDALAKLLAEGAETYLGAKDYYEAMAIPKPRIRASQSKRAKKFPKGFDYSEYGTVEEIMADHDKIQALFPSRGPGNPSKSRDKEAFPIGPLGAVYWVSMDWWEEHVDEGFTPSFAGGDDVIIPAAEYDDADDMDEREFGTDYNNADSRFLLGVFQFVEPRCKARHASSLYERFRKKHKEHREIRTKRLEKLAK